MPRTEFRIVGVVAVVAAAASVLAAPGVLGLVGGAALALVLPGYAVSRALVPVGVDVVDRVLLSVAMTLAVDVLGGALLTVSPWGLDRLTWTVLLLGVTLTALLVAARRAHDDDGPALWRFARPSPATTRLVFTAAQALVVIAVAIGFTARPAQPPEAASGYTLLHLTRAEPGQYRLGVTSGEFRRTTYRLDLVVDGSVARSWPRLTLDPSENWSADIKGLARAGRVDAYLYRDAAPSTVYRHTHVGDGRPTPAPS